MLLQGLDECRFFSFCDEIFDVGLCTFQLQRSTEFADCGGFYGIIPVRLFYVFFFILKLESQEWYNSTSENNDHMTIVEFQ